MSYGEFPAYANNHTNESLMLPNGAILERRPRARCTTWTSARPRAGPGIRRALLVRATPTKPLACIPGMASRSRTSSSVPTRSARAPRSRISTRAESTPGSKRQALARQCDGSRAAGTLPRSHMHAARKTSRRRSTVRSPTSDLPITALFSTLGRTAARGLESQWCAWKMREVFDELMANVKRGDVATANMEKFDPGDLGAATSKGVGYGEAPRGALGHWIHIKDAPRSRATSASCRSTWNASPRDPAGNIGAYEAALARYADVGSRAAA